MFSLLYHYCKAKYHAWLRGPKVKCGVITEVFRIFMIFFFRIIKTESIHRPHHRSETLKLSGLRSFNVSDIGYVCL